MATRYLMQPCPLRSPTGSPDSATEATLRNEGRVPVFLIAALVFADGVSTPWACTVRDLSDGGARLELERAKPPVVSEQLPDLVTVHLCPDRTDVDCRIAWRDGRHFGVQFVGEFRPATRLPI